MQKGACLTVKMEMIINQRKTAAFKGIRSMDAFDDRRFCLHTDQDVVYVWGRNLRVKKWEADQQVLLLEGEIFGVGDPLSFPNDDEFLKEEPFWKRWFK